MPANCWKRLSSLRRLSTSFRNLPHILDLRLEHLTLCCQPRFHDEWPQRHSGRRYPSSVKRLHFDFSHGYVQEQVPQLSLDELIATEELTISGCPRGEIRSLQSSVDMVIGKMHPPSLVFLDIHNLNVDRTCLSLIGNTLKHLVLSSLRSAALPIETITLEQVEVLELLFCQPDEHRERGSITYDYQPFARKVQSNLVFPSLRHLSLSQADALRPLLDLAEFFVSHHDLEAFALRHIRALHPYQSYEMKTRVDISATYDMIRTRQAGIGFPQRCLIHGPFDVPLYRHNTPEFHVEVDRFPNQFGWYRDDPNKERAREAEDVRAARLRAVDPDRKFYETRHTRQYWKDRRPSHRQHYPHDGWDYPMSDIPPRRSESRSP